METSAVTFVAVLLTHLYCTAAGPGKLNDGMIIEADETDDIGTELDPFTFETDPAVGYCIKLLDDVDGKFRISDSNLLTVNGLLDIDGLNPWTNTLIFTNIRIELYESNAKTSDTSLTIKIKPVNEYAPVCSPSIYFNKLSGGARASDLELVQITCEDSLDYGQETITLTLADPGTDSGHFVIEGSWLKLKADINPVVLLSGPGVNTREVQITASDDGTPSMSSTATVIIEVIPEVTSIMSGPDAILISEDQALGELATYTLSGTLNMISFYMSDGDSDTFFVSTDGKLYLIRRLNSDGDSPDTTLRLTISATVSDPRYVGDDAIIIEPITATVTVTDNLDDEEKAAFVNGLYMVRGVITESSYSGTTLLTLDGQVIDREGDSGYTFDVTDTTDFELNGNDVTVASSWVRPDDRSSSPEPTRYYKTLSVTRGPLVSYARLIVIVGNQNNANPTGSGIVVSPDEDTPRGTFLTGVSSAVSDDDHDHTSFTYALSSNPCFTIGSQTGKVHLKCDLDYDRDITEHLVDVIVTDSGSPRKSGTVTVTVSVGNVDDEDHAACTRYYFHRVIQEGMLGAPAEVLTLPCESMEYSARPLTAGTVVVNPTTMDSFSSTGLVINRGTIDFDVESQTTEYSLSVPLGGGPLNVFIDITVEPVDEDPAVALDGSETVPENTAIGHVLTWRADTEFFDPDTGEDLIYALESPSEFFQLDPKVGTLTVVRPLLGNAPLDVLPAQALVVIASGSVHSGSATLTVTIDNTNDHTPTCPSHDRSFKLLSTDVGPKHLVDLRCSDGDLDDTLTYSLQQDYDLFEMVDDGISLKLSADLEDKYDTLFRLSIDVTDVLTPPNSITVEVGVYVEGVNSVGPVFSHGNLTVTIPESFGIGGKVAEVTATDRGHVSYVMSDSGGGTFDVDKITGEIQLLSHLDFEEREQYILEVTAIDDGDLSSTVAVIVNVGDDNDNAPTCGVHLSYHAISENPSAITLQPSDTNLTAYQLEATLDCTDADEGTTLSYTITSGNTDYFHVNSTTSELYLSEAIDFEAGEHVFDGTIIVGDGIPTHATTVIFHVVVIPVDDNDPEIQGQTISVDELNGPGTYIGVMDATDLDGDTVDGHLLFGFTGPQPMFEIDPGNGSLSLVGTLDYDVETSYTLEVQVSSGRPNAKKTASATVTVSVNDIDDVLPFFAQSVYTADVTENAAENTPIVTVTVTDTDGPTLAANYIYSLSLVSGGENHFDININTGDIEILGEHTSDVDYEISNHYELLVTASAPGISYTAQAIVSLDVVNVNEYTPVFDAPLHDEDTYSQSVSENVEIGTLLLDINATDQDAGVDGVIVFSLDPGPPFYIDPESGRLYLASRLDYETTQSYSLDVIVTDKGSPPRSTTAAVTISVLDYNDNTPTCSSNPPVVYPEDLSAGTPILTFTGACTDADGTSDNTGISYSLDAGSMALFAIGETTGEITLGSVSLDYETSKEHSLVIFATDSGTPALTGTTTAIVLVSAINEHTPEAPDGGYVYSVPEDLQVGGLVGELSATDDDDASTNHGRPYFKNLAGDGNEMFSIGDNGLVHEIRLRRPLDREERASYSLTVGVQDTSEGDPNQLSITAAVTITVTDVNDNAPEFPINAGVVEVSEATLVNTVIYTANIDDADIGANGQFTLTIQDGDPVNYFAIDGENLIVNKMLDYEQASRRTYTLLIRATDAGSLPQYREMRLVVLVTPHNEHTPEIRYIPSPKEISEGLPMGAVVFTVTATDLDSGSDGDVIFSLVNITDHGDSFFIDPNTGEVYLTKALDFDTPPTEMYFHVQVRDSSPDPMDRLYATSTILIRITNVNDNPPVFSDTLYVVDILENVNRGSPVLQLEFTDADADTNNPVFTITGGDAGSFTISNDGVIRTAVTLDYETKVLYVVHIRVSDNKVPELTSDTTVRFVVFDVVDIAPVFDPITRARVKEHSPIGTPVTRVHARIADNTNDPTNDVYYGISVPGEVGITFAIGELTGDITTNMELDREVQDSYTVHVMASEEGQGPSATATLTIYVIDINDNPPVVDANIAVSIREDTSPRDVLIDIVATDLDTYINSRMGYTIISQTPGHAGQTPSGATFSIHPDSGFLQTRASLDYEEIQQYVVMVEVCNKGPERLCDTTTVTITILDVNDNRPVCLQPMSIVVPQNAPEGTTIMTVECPDSDSGQNGEVYYEIIAANGLSVFPFQIDATTGIITSTSTFDRTTVPSYDLLIKAEDRGNPSLVTYDTILVEIGEDESEGSNSLEKYLWEVTENTSLTVLGRIHSPFSLSDVTFHIEDATGIAHNYFSINSMGDISLKRLLDREAHDTIVFNVSIEGITLPLSRQSSVYVKVLDRNDNPPIFAPNNSIALVNYKAPRGGTVTTMIVTDADAGENGTLWCTFSDESLQTDMFEIDPRTCKIRKRTVSDLPKNRVMIVRVRATDRGNPIQYYTTQQLYITPFDLENSIVTIVVLVPRDADFQLEDLIRSVEALGLQWRVIVLGYSQKVVNTQARRLLQINTELEISVTFYVVQDLQASDDPTVTPVHVLPQSEVQALLADPLYDGPYEVQSVTTTSTTPEPTPWEWTQEGILVITLFVLTIIILLVIIIILAILLATRKDRRPESARTLTSSGKSSRGRDVASVDIEIISRDLSKDRMKDNVSMSSRGSDIRANVNEEKGGKETTALLLAEDKPVRETPPLKRAKKQNIEQKTKPQQEVAENKPPEEKTPEVAPTEPPVEESATKDDLPVDEEAAAPPKTLPPIKTKKVKKKKKKSVPADVPPESEKEAGSQSSLQDEPKVDESKPRDRVQSAWRYGSSTFDIYSEASSTDT